MHTAFTLFHSSLWINSLVIYNALSHFSTFFTYWISSACVSFPCKNLDTNFMLFQFYSSYLILALPFLIMYALPWTIFTFSFKSSNIPHPAWLINCTCCSSPWPACTPCLEPSWPAFSGTRCPRTDQPSTTEEQIQSEFLHSINISVVLLIGQAKACWLIFSLFFSSLSSSWRSSPWQACRF